MSKKEMEEEKLKTIIPNTADFSVGKLENLFKTFLNEIKDENKEMKKELKEIRKSFEFLSVKFESCLKELRGVKSVNQDQENEIKTLKEYNNQIKIDLRKQEQIGNEIKQSSRSKNLEIFNIQKVQNKKK